MAPLLGARAVCDRFKLQPCLCQFLAACHLFCLRASYALACGNREAFIDNMSVSRVKAIIAVSQYW